MTVAEYKFAKDSLAVCLSILDSVVLREREQTRNGMMFLLYVTVWSLLRDSL
jgi:hypothetical protein